MSSRTRPRIVIVTRKTPLEELLERRGTHAQARFHLGSRGQSIEPYEEGHRRQQAALAAVMGHLPADQRRTRVDRGDLDRFLFAPDDVVLVVGQDGLVPNVAKYLAGQRVIGVNPDPERFDGVLCRHRAEDLPALLRWLETGQGPYALQDRVMAAAEREDGQRLLALNELFLGHRTHQSARYELEVAGARERHSSSGVVVATGTGSTGWARSIHTQRGLTAPLPRPTDPYLAWFVREPFPSVATGTALDFGLLHQGQTLVVDSRMGEEGVVFADGIEADRLELLDGHRVTVGVAPERLHLVVRG